MVASIKTLANANLVQTIVLYAQVPLHVVYAIKDIMLPKLTLAKEVN